MHTARGGVKKKSLKQLYGEENVQQLGERWKWQHQKWHNTKKLNARIKKTQNDEDEVWDSMTCVWLCYLCILTCEHGHGWWREVSWWLPHWSQNEPFLWHRVNAGTSPQHTHTCTHAHTTRHIPSQTWPQTYKQIDYNTPRRSISHTQTKHMNVTQTHHHTLI